LEHEKNILLLESYIRNQADNLTVKQVKSRLENDEAFASLYQELLGIHQGIRLSVLDDKLKILKQYDKRLPASSLKKIESHNTSVRSMGIKKWIGLAASILLLAMAGLWFTNQESTSNGATIFASVIEPLEQDVVSTIRSGNGKETDILLTPEEILIAENKKKAYRLYNAEAFDKALPYFEDLTKLDSDNIHLFYKSFCHLMVGDIDEARQGLYHDYGSEIDSNDLAYARAMLALRESNFDKVRSLLEPLPDNYKRKTLEAIKTL